VRVWVTVPTYDEADNIQTLVSRVRRALPDAAILVVDDGSIDGTADKVDAMRPEYPGVEVLRRPRKMGLGSAYRAGHAIGLARGYDVMIQMDADLSHDPAELPRLLAAVERGADLAIGSRYVEGGSVPNWPKHRLMLSIAGNKYAAAVLGIDIKDSTAGYRAYRASVLRAMHFETTTSTGYSYQIEMTDRVLGVGGNIVEVPITFTDRVRGTSKMSWRIIGEAMALVTLWGLRGRLRRRMRSRATRSRRTAAA
jgi:glycosyltransferase involved in cell wall biosynthesis